MPLRDFSRENFDCKKCGNCCKELSSSLTIDSEKYRSWTMLEVDTELGTYFASEFAKKIDEETYDLFYDPVTKEELSACPFLVKKERGYKCIIYNYRPERCKEFPFLEKLIDPTREKLCKEVNNIVKENEDLLEELKMFIFKYYVKEKIEKNK